MEPIAMAREEQGEEKYCFLSGEYSLLRITKPNLRYSYSIFYTKTIYSLSLCRHCLFIVYSKIYVYNVGGVQGVGKIMRDESSGRMKALAKNIQNRLFHSLALVYSSSQIALQSHSWNYSLAQNSNYLAQKGFAL